MDSMVRTTMATEREIDDSRSIRDAGVSEKKRENQYSFSRGNTRISGARPRLSGPRPSWVI